MFNANYLVVSGFERVRDLARELDSLRLRLGLESDFSTEVSQLLSLNDRKTRRPVCVLFRDDNSVPQRAVILFERCLYGIGTGVLRAGDHAGDGAVIAPPNERSDVLLAAVDFLLKERRYHTVFGAVCRPGEPSSHLIRDPQMAGAITSRIVRRRLSLSGSYEATVASFCRRMRKGVRNKRRRFDKRTDVDWLTYMSPELAREAMTALSQTSQPCRTVSEIECRYDFLRNHAEAAFAMALRLDTGEWMSFITGWRADGVTYVPWAMHNLKYRSDSLATVMYARLIEHEIDIGQRRIEWVGGVTELWSTVCEPEECLCVMRVRPGLRSFCIRWIIARLLQGQTALEYYQNELSSESEDDDHDLEVPVKPEAILASSAKAQSLTSSPQ